MPSQYEIDKVFMKMAGNISSLSNCAKTKVGALAAIDNRPVITGYNGTPPGHENCCDHFAYGDLTNHRRWSIDNEVHAEMNVINFAAKEGISLEGATLYCTLQPCNQCIKNFPAVGIKRVVYKDLYDGVESPKFTEDFLLKSGIELVRIQD
jgi:dCMP deaminase